MIATSPLTAIALMMGPACIAVVLFFLGFQWALLGRSPVAFVGMLSEDRMARQAMVRIIGPTALLLATGMAALLRAL